MVVIVLITLWVLTVLIARVAALCSKTPAGPVQTTAAAVSASPAPTEDDQGLTDEEVIAITASVAALIGKEHKVVSIQPVQRDWSREGRREHFASHRIR